MVTVRGAILLCHLETAHTRQRFKIPGVLAKAENEVGLPICSLQNTKCSKRRLDEKGHWSEPVSCSKQIMRATIGAVTFAEVAIPTERLNRRSTPCGWDIMCSFTLVMAIRSEHSILIAIFV